MTTRTLFFFADCGAAALTGAATALAVRLATPPSFDMVVAMGLGMVIGTAVHLFLGIVLSPLLGMFETMVPGMYVGMYGGMLFGMRDSMQQEIIPLGAALVVGAAFGVVVAVTIHFWNAQLRRRAYTEELPQ